MVTELTEFRCNGFYSGSTIALSYEVGTRGSRTSSAHRSLVLL